MTNQPEKSSGYDRLDEQIQWYDRKSGYAQRCYKWTKITEIIFAAAVPLVAPSHGQAAAVLGGGVLLIETLQHLNQWQHNWITYRATCESLRHEKYSYLGRSGPYDELSDSAAFKLLVERVEGLISTEHSKWITQQEANTAKKTAKRP